MYTLYYLPGTSSLAIHVLLNEIGTGFKLVERPDAAEYIKINPALKVPALVDGETTVFEGAAVALYLMEKHPSTMLPSKAEDRIRHIQWMMFANASMYHAYGKLFFANRPTPDPAQKDAALTAAAAGVSAFWKVIDNQLENSTFLCGKYLSMADIMLAVYAGWNKNFPGRVTLGENCLRMIREVTSRESFRKAVATEKIDFQI